MGHRPLANYMRLPKICFSQQFVVSIFRLALREYQRLDVFSDHGDVHYGAVLNAVSLRPSYGLFNLVNAILRTKFSLQNFTPVNSRIDPRISRLNLKLVALGRRDHASKSENNSYMSSSHIKILMRICPVDKLTSSSILVIILTLISVLPVFAAEVDWLKVENEDFTVYYQRG